MAHDPLEQLFRAAEPPLRYLSSTEPRLLAPNALPTEHLIGLADTVRAGYDDTRVRTLLDRLRGIFGAFPLEDVSARKRAAREGLAALAELRAAVGGPWPAGAPGPAAEGAAESDASLKTPRRGRDSGFRAGRKARGGADPADEEVGRRTPAGHASPPASSPTRTAQRGSRHLAASSPNGLQALSAPIQFVRGVGPRRAEALERMHLATVEDLLYHLPFRYEDRRELRRLGRLVPGEEATCLAEVAAVGQRRGGRGRTILEAVVRDGSGTLALVWFQRTSWFARRLAAGQRVVVHGKVEPGRGRRQMVHPDVEWLEGAGSVGPREVDGLGRIVPVYEKPMGVTVGWMRKVVHAAVDEAVGLVPSVVPEHITRRRGLMAPAAALRLVHQPSPAADVGRLSAFCSEAHRSLVFDELFFLALGMLLRRSSVAAEPGLSFRPKGVLEQRFRKRLPFRLTGAQERVSKVVASDMAAPHPMHRLVQGDVGTGKTVLAALAALGAIECGAQAALMTPTEILAEQHLVTLRGWFEPLGLRVDLLTGRLGTRTRRGVLESVADGSTHLLVGTHAVIQEGVRFARLGLGIVDEQHRFGVLQRKAVQGLGQNPDTLLLTATPIPRTLAITLYGDLSISFLDERPPGREPIETRVVPERRREAAYADVRAALDAGRQAYLVFPLVEESETSDLRSATAMARDLATGPLAGYRVALLHGQMKGDEKDAVMRRFQAGDHQALIATTVVEVGIDVANATVMMIDHADRFGLAQLHQLRGRVGRGGGRSLCLLVASGRSGVVGLERLRLLEREIDGRQIAEADLEIRGPGDLLGLRQSGMPDFRVANIVRDLPILEEAREDAVSILANDPTLSTPESANLRTTLEQRWRGRLGLASIG